ncbi:adenylate/guanylate cyclase domain-containing protein [Ancylomarina longa]|uniref:Adenylate/guanylate cyclase domain-containing protein n=1 Tax=Ancylomarina longa TaxID=2487017 RepID=A0A434AU79_9BACT|nr:adenylate/guanylate cyclase domain-containing protein [Ancylomarina longa]RUT77963.1 adenylate/guanylate cyclase domain-containing protein [Ancylomarina longa]
MNKIKFKKKLYNIGGYFIASILIWMIAFYLLVLFQLSDSSEISILNTVSLKNSSLAGVFSGLIWGLIFKITHPVRHKIPTYWLSVLVLFSINILSAFLLVYCFYHLNGIFTMIYFPPQYSKLEYLYTSKLFYAILSYFFIVGTLIEIFHDIDRKFGRGVLMKFLLGRYFKPKEEDRIFLFMDLKSSTYYAEKLGHFKYSRLIQDCFRDISSAVIKNKAHIYQFVGDEVVLTWKLKEGIEKIRCIQVFYDFNNSLEKHKDYYQEHYGMVPIFKAGVHSGKVMVAEVGDIKSEIAYHGDAINTASRIQSMCNNYKTRFLISGDLLTSILDKNSFDKEYSHIGNVLLIGKQKSTDLFSLHFN